MLIFSSRYFVWRAFSLACRTVSWERKEERRRGGEVGEKEWRERESDGEREGEEEEIEEKQRGRKRKRDHFDCNFKCTYV